MFAGDDFLAQWHWNMCTCKADPRFKALLLCKLIKAMLPHMAPKKLK